MKKALILLSFVSVFLGLIILGIGEKYLVNKKEKDILYKRIKNHMRAFSIYIAKCVSERGKCPSNLIGIEELANEIGLYDLSFREGLPLDPWNKPYIYLLQNSIYVIVTYGADEKPGGSGVNRDIKFSNLGYFSAKLNDLIISADNETSSKKLSQLSNNSCSVVRLLVAKNCTTPKHVLIKLTSDKNEYVRKAATINLSNSRTSHRR